MSNEKHAADTFPKLLWEHANRRGDHPAYREKNRGIWRTTTWRHLCDEVTALAVALSQRGLKRGAHVAFLGDNRPRLYAGICAAQSLGAIALPLYQDSAADELAAPIQSAGVTHVFAENQEQVDKLLTILPRCPTIQCIVYDDDRSMRHYKQPELVSYAQLLATGKDLVASQQVFLTEEIARGSGSDDAFVFFTSGATGAAKGAVFSYDALIERARVAVASEGLTDSDVAMAYLSPGWLAQALFSYVQPMVVGFCVCCPESSDTMLADMREVAPSHFLATPRVLETLLAQVEARAEDSGGFNRQLYRRAIAAGRKAVAQLMDSPTASGGAGMSSAAYSLLIYRPLVDVLGMSKLRNAYVSGDAASPDLIIFFRALGVNLKQLYGSTETGFFVAMHSDGAVKADTVGPAVRGVEIKLTPEREILVRSPGLFREYIGDSAATQKVITSDGWFHTGDAGYLGDDGQLRIIDRLGNVGALKDGTRFSPRALENRLKDAPYIKEAIVFGAGRDSVTALVDIDLTLVGRWADKKLISYMGHADLASRDETYGLINDWIAEVNSILSRDSELAKCQIRRFALLPKELDPDDGLLTRTGKLRRDVIAQRFKPLIDAFYTGASNARIESEDTGPAEVKIQNVTAVASAQGRRAA